MHSPHPPPSSKPLHPSLHPYPSPSPSPSPSSPPSSLLHHYTVLHPIGNGTFGRVSLIRRLSDHSLFVWKELSYGSMTEKEKAQLVAEVNILRDLHHRHIVRYHDRIIDRPHRRIFIVMEYCKGGDLSTLIKAAHRQHSPLPLPFILRILSQTSAALQHCHSHSTLHRDLKPHNVFLDQHGHVKLGDFGLARVLSSSASCAATHAGTPYYMAPEQVRGVGVGVKSDVWGLGCLVYEMCALQPPFQAGNALQLARRIERGEWDEEPVRRYGEDMVRAVRGMLAVEISQRWSVEDVLAFVAARGAGVGEQGGEGGGKGGAAGVARGEKEKAALQAVEAERLLLLERERRVKDREERLDRREAALQRREEDADRRERVLAEAEGRRRLQAVHRRTTLTASPSFPPSPPASPTSSLSSSSSTADSPSHPPHPYPHHGALSPVPLASPLARLPRTKPRPPPPTRVASKKGVAVKRQVAGVDKENHVQEHYYR